MSDDIDTDLEELYALIERRQAELPADSYTTSLLTHEKGANRALEKLGEEAVETVLAAKDGDPEALTAEAVDLIYHLWVVLAMHDVDMAALREELDSRN